MNLVQAAAGVAAATGMTPCKVADPAVAAVEAAAVVVAVVVVVEVVAAVLSAAAAAASGAGSAREPRPATAVSAMHAASAFRTARERPSLRNWGCSLLRSWGRWELRWRPMPSPGCARGRWSRPQRGRPTTAPRGARAGWGRRPGTGRTRRRGGSRGDRARLGGPAQRVWSPAVAGGGLTVVTQSQRGKPQSCDPGPPDAVPSLPPHQSHSG